VKIEMRGGKSASPQRKALMESLDALFAVNAPPHSSKPFLTLQLSFRSFWFNNCLPIYTSGPPELSGYPASLSSFNARASAGFRWKHMAGSNQSLRSRIRPCMGMKDRN